MSSMRTILSLVALFLLSGCDAVASKPKPANSTSKRRPPASLPILSKPAPSATVWRVVSVHDGDTLRAVDEGKVEHKVRLVGIDAVDPGQALAMPVSGRPCGPTRSLCASVLAASVGASPEGFCRPPRRLRQGSRQTSAA